MAAVSKQRFFSKTVRHLLKQRRKSKKVIGGEDMCAYRGKGGLKCAIGCHIPDKLYRNSFEGRSLEGLTEAFPFIKRLIPDVSLGCNLQRVHDGHEVREWKAELARTARLYGLKMPRTA